MGCATSKMEEPSVPARLAPDKTDSYRSIDTGEPSSQPKRRSVCYDAKELASPSRSTRLSIGGSPEKSKFAAGAMASTFGTHTRHGVVPGPSGSAFAKINQDRGAVYWPFNDSHNEALLAVFDGHGVAGEKVAELCIEHIPMLLQERGAELRDDPPKILSETVMTTEDEVR